MYIRIRVHISLYVRTRNTGMRLHPRLWAPPTLGFPPLPPLKLAPIRSVGKGADFPDISRTKQDDEALERAREAHGRRVALGFLSCVHRHACAHLDGCDVSEKPR